MIIPLLFIIIPPSRKNKKAFSKSPNFKLDLILLICQNLFKKCPKKKMPRVGKSNFQKEKKPQIDIYTYK